MKKGPMKMKKASSMKMKKESGMKMKKGAAMKMGHSPKKAGHKNDSVMLKLTKSQMNTVMKMMGKKK
jgi:hypothetical protein|tara:strand:+ start:267 stop:467 length:201 start_codon:yes stop_codon:yes gene_type:complete